MQIKMERENIPLLAPQTNYFQYFGLFLLNIFLHYFNS